VEDPTGLCRLGGDGLLPRNLLLCISTLGLTEYRPHLGGTQTYMGCHCVLFCWETLGVPLLSLPLHIWRCALHRWAIPTVSVLPHHTEDLFDLWEAPPFIQPSYPADYLT